MDTIEPDCAVTLRYTMRTQLPDGVAKERPEEKLTFVFGVDRQAPSLETALHGARIGDRIQASIPASEIYGEHDPQLIFEIPRQGLIKQRLKKGRFYRQMKKGCLVSFKVLEVRPQTVLADFNKPMAGISATMDLEVVEIRKANRKEIESAREAQLKKNIGCG